jgi:AbrB family looped-hinge helix DNA binding protein
MDDSTTGQKLQDEMLKTVRKSQEAVIDAIRTWADTVQSIMPKLPGVDAPTSEKSPRPEEVVASAHDFAEQLLSSQRTFSDLVRLGTFSDLARQQAFSESPVPRVVSVGKEGRITVPADLRKTFGLQEGSRVVIHVDKVHGGLILQPAVTIPRDPAWVSDPEHRARLARSYADADAGRIRRMSDDLAEELLDE